MKPTLRSLKLHQQVWALVEEIIAQDEVIINFGGDLIRVLNQTNKLLKSGQRVQVQVEELYPLKLKLVESSRRSDLSRRSLDVQI